MSNDHLAEIEAGTIPAPQFEINQKVIIAWLQDSIHRPIIFRNYRPYAGVWSYYIHDGTSRKWINESNLKKTN